MSDGMTNADDLVRTLTNRSFGRLVLDGAGPIAVEFMSYGCGYCRAIEPILQQVAAEIAGEETIYRVNIATELELAGEYRIGGTPTFIMFQDGHEVDRVEGPDPSLASITSTITGAFVS